ncbi:MAG: TlpA disulfide reductase family protein, partial [Verrucomicrobiota bacterium]
VVSGDAVQLGQMLGGDDVMISGGRATVEVSIREDGLEVAVDDMTLADFEVDSQRRRGNGISFRTGGPWPNGETRLNPLEISQFEVRSSSGLLNTLRVDQEAKDQALLIPRFRRERPDEHLLIATNGDLIRGHLKSVGPTWVEFVTRLRSLKLERERLAGLILLADDEGFDPGEVSSREVYVFLTDGSAVRLTPQRMTQTMLSGTSPALGSCQLPVANIRQIKLGGFDVLAGRSLYADWIRKPAPEPVIQEEGAGKGAASRVVGDVARSFVLPQVGSEDPLKLEASQGRIAVLNFWASWSGPSRQCLSEVLRAVDGRQTVVDFLTVNQAEPVEVIQAYLERNKWSFPVGIDRAENLGEAFGLESIPHTVVIDRNGRIRWAESGYRLGIGASVAEILDQLEEETVEEPDPKKIDGAKGTEVTSAESL